MPFKLTHLMHIATVAIALFLFCSAGTAQDLSPGPSVGDDGGDLFDDPDKLELYDEVLGNLQGMKYSGGQYGDDERSDREDWFVVGGSLTSKKNGRVDAAFTSFQGTENVARKIVEFEFGKHGVMVPEWRVFKRYDSSELASQEADELLTQFRRYAVAQDRLAQQQRIRSQQRRVRRRSGSC